jgi:signal recognition particle receptor subunit beta
MAQWSHADRTLYAKLVYYGPSYGGKTTNLEVLHRITDPEGERELVSIRTADDRTLFFDLLPFDLGEILGYQVAVKVYTVPGQVRYETSRQVLLGGADGIVFVADSSRRREEHNRWSLQNLRMNMRSKGLDPERVPVLYQFNKQDLEDAARPEEVSAWLGLKDVPVIPSVAVSGEGVVETFVEAARSMLGSIVNLADERTRREIDASDLEIHLDRAFGPYVGAGQKKRGPSPSNGPDPDSRAAIVVRGNDILENAIATSADLGERFVDSAFKGRAAQVAEPGGDAAGLRDGIDATLADLRRAVERLGAGGGRNRRALKDSALDSTAELEGLVSRLLQTASKEDAPRTTVPGRRRR